MISGCSQCSACDVISGIVICAQCSMCNNVPSSQLNNNLTIESATFTSVLYAKHIYYILMTEASSFVTIPILNDTYTYQDIYSVLTTQTTINFAPESVYECTACPISSTSCYVKNAFDANSLSDYTVGNTDLIEQISYLLFPYECRTGFVYDENLGKCKFCPSNWTSCKAYKNLNITFASSSNASDPYTVTSIDDLLKLSEVLEATELSYILNEFAVEAFNIYLLFPSEFTMTWSATVVEYIINWATIIPSLSSFSLIFQPINYETNKDSFSDLYWEVQWIISGFSDVTFQNIIFHVLPSINMVVVPGLIIYIQTFSMVNCSIIPSQGDLSLNNGISEVIDSSYNYEYIWQVNLQANSQITLSNITINLSMSISEKALSNNQFIFNFQGALAVNISDLLIEDSQIALENVFVIESQEIYVTNISFVNCIFITTTLLSSSLSQSVAFENILIKNSSLTDFLLNSASDSLTIIVTNFVFSNTSLIFSVVSNTLINCENLIMINFVIFNSYLEISNLFYFTQNLTMTNVSIYNNKEFKKYKILDQKAYRN